MPSVRQTVSSGGVIGLADVKKKLEVLGPRIATNVLRRGLVAAAGLIRDDAKPRISVKTGHLKRDLIGESRGIFKGGDGKPIGHRAVVLVRKKSRKGSKSARWRAHFLEYGTAPHTTGKGSILKVWKGSKKVANQRGKRHPGAKAKPFLRPAFDAKKHEAIQVAERKIREELAKEVAKLAGARKVA